MKLSSWLYIFQWKKKSILQRSATMAQCPQRIRFLPYWKSDLLVIQDDVWVEFVKWTDEYRFSRFLFIVEDDLVILFFSQLLLVNRYWSKCVLTNQWWVLALFLSLYQRRKKILEMIYGTLIRYSYLWNEAYIEYSSAFYFTRSFICFYHIQIRPKLEFSIELYLKWSINCDLHLDHIKYTIEKFDFDLNIN